MRTVPTLSLLAMIASSSAVALPQTQTAPSTPPQAAPEAAEPEHIKVQHILIGFQGSVPGKPITRTAEEARTLAYALLERARKGEDFDKLVKEYTDDAHPGIYALSNRGVPPRQGEYQRTQMVPAFGDVGFPLAVGEVGIADHDPRTSRYGWHIVKRLE